ncbi:DMT family transporter [Massilia alkalitolerans]|uniref:DMT family transporter n=1 Tax=Massilia alkalitolerans TaxID=286638 RepID=UPI0009FC3F13|nr:DMT family transporter [Massilia alkalitolerans]
MHTGVLYALLAAALFGASTPFSKQLTGSVDPVMLAGLLYLGSGLGLATWFALRRALAPDSGPALVPKGDLPWLAGAILSGGIAGPVLLMVGLVNTPASSASLLLNLEGVLTAMLAWFVFKENFDRRIFLGMVFIVAAGALLSWSERPEFGIPWGPLAIVAACLCWAIDNNLTRKVSASDPVQIACLKGLTAGTVNLVIAFSLGQQLPEATTVLTAATVGLCGYGISLVLFVLALRHLGTARAGAYFSAAPFAGALIALVMFGERPGIAFWTAAVLMGIGLWLHLTESHGHAHEHTMFEHEHVHDHDTHHEHEHDAGVDTSAPHSHHHVHEPLTHSHEHYPDIHHRHDHATQPKSK